MARLLQRVRARARGAACALGCRKVCVRVRAARFEDPEQPWSQTASAIFDPSDLPSEPTDPQPPSSPAGPYRGERPLDALSILAPQTVGPSSWVDRHLHSSFPDTCVGSVRTQWNMSMPWDPAPSKERW